MKLKELMFLISCYSEVVIKERKVTYLGPNIIVESEDDRDCDHLIDTHHDLYGDLLKFNYDDYIVEKISIYPMYIEIIVTRKESR